MSWKLLTTHACASGDAVGFDAQAPRVNSGGSVPQYLRSADVPSAMGRSTIKIRVLLLEIEAHWCDMDVVRR